MTRRLLFLLPIVVFSALVGFCALRLILVAHGHTPDLIPSVLVNHPAPAFDLPPLLADTPGLRTDDLKGKVTILNFFASTCVPCRAEHPLLAGLKGDGVTLAGIPYKNRSTDAASWLENAGDPYDAIGVDADSRTAIDFGVYGVPETYVIDRRGTIRFKQTGPLTPELIRQRLEPLIKELKK